MFKTITMYFIPASFATLAHSVALKCFGLKQAGVTLAFFANAANFSYIASTACGSQQIH